MLVEADVVNSKKLCIHSFISLINSAAALTCGFCEIGVCVFVYNSKK